MAAPLKDTQVPVLLFVFLVRFLSRDLTGPEQIQFQVAIVSDKDLAMRVQPNYNFPYSSMAFATLHVSAVRVSN